MRFRNNIILERLKYTNYCRLFIKIQQGLAKKCNVPNILVKSLFFFFNSVLVKYLFDKTKKKYELIRITLKQTWYL